MPLNRSAQPTSRLWPPTRKRVGPCAPAGFLTWEVHDGVLAMAAEAAQAQQLHDHSYRHLLSTIPTLALARATTQLTRGTQKNLLTPARCGASACLTTAVPETWVIAQTSHRHLGSQGEACRPAWSCRTLHA